MRIIRQTAICFLCCCLLAGIVSPAMAQGRDPEFEQEIYDRLAAINPDAVPLFIQATAASDSGDYQSAISGFTQVLALAPDFPDALRRLSFAEAQLGLLDDALLHAQRAFDLDPSAVNKINLAEKLVFTEVPVNTSRALALAKEAIPELPEDTYAHYVLMIAAYVQEDDETLKVACETLFRIAPEYPISHYLYALVMAENGRWEQAERELLIARDLGYPSDEIDRVLQDTGITHQARLFRTARWTGYTVIAWVGGFSILFLIGLVLSKTTLSTVQRNGSRAGTDPSRGEKRIRSFYRTVIAIAATYFYLSIPLIILLLLAFIAGIIYYLVIQRGLFNYLTFMIILSVLYPLFAIVRGIFFRQKQGQPGQPVTQAEQPYLWRLTQEVASQLHTAPIQVIYLAPGAEIAVFEQGTLVQKLRGQGKRALLLGLGVLNGMRQGQLKSILAHEYGHFSANDTAGGELAYRVQRSMHSIAVGLINSGQANGLNPTWLFIAGFYKLFLRITLGASRLQEILADRFALAAYGARNFCEGLRHIVRQTITFDVQVSHAINQALQQGTPLQNLYTLPLPSSGEDIQALENAYQKAFDKPTTTLDSHPSPAQRCQMVEQLHLPEKFPDPDDDRPAWELFTNPEKWQVTLTAEVMLKIGSSRKIL